MSISKNQNITTSECGETDATLRIAGKAADSKIVGDMFNSLTLGVDADDGLVYLYCNGQKQGLGVQLSDGSGSSVIRRRVTYNLPHATSTNHAVVVPESVEYKTFIAAEKRYKLIDVVVTMDGAVVLDAYNAETSLVTVDSVRGDIVIHAYTEILPLDLLDVSWADHAISCGQATNSYNAWSPHNMQYDDVHDKWLILQCHANKHLNQTYTTWTLSEFNPHDPTDVTDIPIPTNNRLGMLHIENGVWWLFARYTNLIYRSSDEGSTWETIELDYNLPRLFGIYKVGGEYFAGDDANSGKKYYHSTDLLNWETLYFDDSLPYDTLCETTFCEFNGRYWAFNRTNDSKLGHPVILVSDDNGQTWQLFSDQFLHGYRSTVSCIPFKTYIMIADIDRDNGYIYYSTFDGETVQEIKSWRIPSGGDDFHNINLASNYTDTVVIEFMHGVPYYSKSGGLYYAQRACDNVMLVGSTKPLPSLKRTFFANSTELTTWLNENCVAGRAELGNSYRWVYGSGTGIKLQKMIGSTWSYLQSENEFDDEIEVPLGLVRFTSNYSEFFLKDGDHFVKLWHNRTTAPEKGYYANYSERIGVVFVNGIRYEYGMMRSGDLPILIRVDYNYSLSFTPNNSQNQVNGYEWQHELGLRRVFHVCINKSNAGIGASNNIKTSQFVLLEYVPADKNE